MPAIDFKQIFTPRNRGRLLDVVVFVCQLLALAVLTRLLAALARQAQTDGTAKATMAVFCFALILLQPVGAILKRRRVHERKARA
ncbi:MAG TPA: hypothetical protein VE821_03100, partial [Pyrinomonadaceae bacterium]|nr:hypothetical protein [Pyrinomonadaceae bacterium]